MHLKGHVDQRYKENCDANNVEELKGVMRGKRCGAMLIISFSTITISFSLGGWPEQNYFNPITY